MKQIFSTSPREMFFDSFLPPKQFNFTNQNSKTPLADPSSFLVSSLNSDLQAPQFVQQTFTPIHTRKTSTSSVSSFSILRPSSRLSRKSISQPNSVSQNRKSIYTLDSLEQSSNICISWNHVHQLTANAVARYRLADSFRPDIIVAASVSSYVLTVARILHTYLQAASSRPIAFVGLRFLPKNSLDLDKFQQTSFTNFDSTSSESVNTYSSSSEAQSSLPSFYWMLLDPGAMDIISNDPTTSPIDFLGKNVLIVDNTDETSITLSNAIHAVRSSQNIRLKIPKIVSNPLLSSSISSTTARKSSISSILSSDDCGVELPSRIRIGVFVLHDKMIPKEKDIQKWCEEGRTYYPAAWVPPTILNIPPAAENERFDDRYQNRSTQDTQTGVPPWIVYPWDVIDLEEHDRIAKEQENIFPMAYPTQEEGKQSRNSLAFEFEEQIFFENIGRKKITDKVVRRFAAAMQESAVV
ncbi:hypoxanthine-guanine phosphoribosyltransferase [Nowakowskiella sp. JEL0078]|nr:hypoxanthine-guanine phosphoribosyltransferase [Nowakowskiella sp. JEL0078]